jgi:1,2-diacylglycerol 3-alpha-glucosyltransferase
MRVLLATDLYLPAINGVVTSTVSLKKSLEELGHEVKVLTLSKEDYIDEEADIYAVSSFNVNKIYPGARVRFFNDRTALKTMIEWHPEIIHTHSEFSTFRMAKFIAQFLNIPIVHTYHTIYEDYTHYFSPNKKTGRKLVSIMTRKVLNNVTEVIAPTEKVYNLLENYGVTQPISTIPTGIQLSRFTHEYSNADCLALRQKYNIPVEAFLLISLGRLGKEKNIEEIINYLARKENDIYFLIVGDGPNRESLADLTKETEISARVIFTGMIKPEHVPLFYQTADLFVSASTSETQGLTYIEALASGIPALCRLDESIENVVINGETGYQYQTFDEFWGYLNVFLNDAGKYQHMATAARKLALENYSSKSFGQSVEKVYKQAIKSYYSNEIMSAHH